MASDPRLYTELDELYELGNADPAKRMALLEKNHATVVKRNDSYLREIMVQVLAGRYDEAIDSLAKSHFHVREGGGEIRDVYVDAHLLRGISRLKAGKPKDALADFLAAAEYPENLSIGQPKNDPRAAQLAYYAGCAQEAMGDAEKAKQCFTDAAGRQGRQGRQGGSPEARFYRALCMKKLGQEAEAAAIFEELIKTGTERLTRGEDADFFAKFGEQQTKQVAAGVGPLHAGPGLSGQGRCASRPASNSRPPRSSTSATSGPERRRLSCNRSICSRGPGRDRQETRDA